MPSVPSTPTSRVGLGSAFAKISRDLGSKMVHPAPDGLVGDHDGTFRQQIFDVAKAQGKPNVKPDRLLDDFGREPVPFVADILHSLGYLTASEAARPNCRDNAIETDDSKTAACASGGRFRALALLSEGRTASRRNGSNRAVHASISNSVILGFGWVTCSPSACSTGVGAQPRSPALSF